MRALSNAAFRGEFLDNIKFNSKLCDVTTQYKTVLLRMNAIEEFILAIL
jgi:hypothetical protein